MDTAKGFANRQMQPTSGVQQDKNRNSTKSALYLRYCPKTDDGNYSHNMNPSYVKLRWHKLLLLHLYSAWKEAKNPLNS